MKALMQMALVATTLGAVALAIDLGSAVPSLPGKGDILKNGPSVPDGKRVAQGLREKAEAKAKAKAKAKAEKAVPKDKIRASGLGAGIPSL